MEHSKHLSEEHGSRFFGSPKLHSREKRSQRKIEAHFFFWNKIFREPNFLLHVTRLFGLELELEKWRCDSPILLETLLKALLHHDSINPFDSRALRFWCLPFRFKDFNDCKLHVILRVQKIRKRGTFFETNMTPRNFNEERSPGVSEAFAWLWAEVWFAFLRRFPANYTPSLWRERSLLSLRSTFSLRVVTYQRI